jgi:superfamily II RNA helicase
MSAIANEMLLRSLNTTRVTKAEIVTNSKLVRRRRRRGRRRRGRLCGRDGLIRSSEERSGSFEEEEDLLLSEEEFAYEEEEEEDRGGVFPSKEEISSEEEVLSVKRLERYYEYKLDKFQKEAAEILIEGHSLVVSAPTGSGKTLIGECAIMNALLKKKKAIYTTPLKALSNQKLREFQIKFGKKRVGLKTGDVEINAEKADVMIMTTEILRNMLYSSAAGGVVDQRLDDVGVVILDEVHYLGDTYRGTVWEETIIYCPKEIQLLCLSATIGNPDDLSGWIEEVRKEDENDNKNENNKFQCKTLVSDYRPVPLNWFYSMKPNRDWPGLGYLLNSRGTKMNAELYPFTEDGMRENFDRYGANEEMYNNNNNNKNNNMTTTTSMRDVSQESKSMRRRLVPHVETTVGQLISADMLPAIWFIFSRKGCDQAVEYLCRDAGACLVSRAEQIEITKEIDAFVALNKDAVRQDMIEPLKCGVASHHAGLLPAWKGLVEALFQRGLVKVVFATETLAAGVNMPARCTVMSALSKRGDAGPRTLTSNEFFQMAGRAGRRGFDDVGYVVCLQSPFDGPENAFSLVSGEPENLKSQFAISYGMVLNLLRGDKSLSQIRSIVEKSFGNFLGGKARMGQMRELNRLLDKLNMLKIAESKSEIIQEDIDESEWNRFIKLEERLSVDKGLLEMLESQSKDTKIENMREGVWDALTFGEGFKIVAVDVGWTRADQNPAAQKSTKGTTFGLLDDGSLIVEKGDSGGKEEFFANEDVDVDGIFDSDYVEEDMGDDDDDDDDRVSREILEKRKLRASLPVLVVRGQRKGETLSPLGEFTGLGADGMWYRFDAHKIVSTNYYIGAADEDSSKNFAELSTSLGNPPSDSSIRWRRSSQMYRANGNAKTSAAAANLPGTCDSFSAYEEDADTAQYLDAQRKKIESIQCDLGVLSNVAMLRQELKLQKKRKAKTAKLSERTRKLEARIREYSAAGWDDFMRVVNILEQRNALVRVLPPETAENFSSDDVAIGEIEILEFGEVCMAFRGENELWIGTVLSKLPDTIPVTVLAGICGAMSSDANRAVNAFYAPSQELLEMLESFVPDLEEIADLQFSSRIDNAPLSLSEDLAALLEQWASGVSWSQIRGDTSLQEGDIARVFKRTAELLAQIPRAPHVSERLKKTAKEAERIVNRPPISDLI